MRVSLTGHMLEKQNIINMKERIKTKQYTKGIINLINEINGKIEEILKTYVKNDPESKWFNLFINFETEFWKNVNMKDKEIYGKEIIETYKDKLNEFFNNGVIHLIDKEPNENISDTYKRGWFIVKNKGESNYNKLYSLIIVFFYNI